MSVTFVATIVLVLGVFLIGLKSAVGTLDAFWANRHATAVRQLVYTIVATQVGGGTVIGIAGSTYSSGTGFGLVALVSTLTGLLALAWMAPRIKEFASGRDIYTLPGFLGARYGRAAEKVSALVIIAAYFALLAGQFVAAETFLALVTPYTKVANLVIASLGIVLYGMASGIRGDIKVDRILFFIMSVMMFSVFVCIINKFGNVNINNIPYRIWSPLTFGGYTYLIAGMLFGVIIPVVSMEMWMRVFAANSSETAKKAYIYSAILIIPFYIIPMLIGLYAVATGLRISIPDYTFVKAMKYIMPKWAMPLVISSLLAVILSTSNTLVLVASASIGRNLLSGLKNDLPSHRIIVGIVGGASLLLAYAVDSIVDLVLSAFFMISVLAPSVFLAVLGKDVNEKLLAAGMGLGAISTIIALPYLGNQAFIPGFLISCIIGWISYVKR